jgi:hypothetical protein
MNKSILVKLAGIAAAVSLLVGGAYAVFSSNQVTITGVVLGSATPGLQVYTGSGNDWSDTVDGATLGIKESNMYPGFVGVEHTFKLRNTSDVSVPFGQIVANLPSEEGPNWDALKGVVQMRFGETGADWSTPWYTLSEWKDGSANILLSQLPGGSTERQFSVQFQMLSSADDGARGQNLSFTLGFLGMTP